MRKRLHLLAFVLTTSISASSQPHVPVDLITGKTLVSVLLGEISSGRISVPILLTYNSTGVKPGSPEGNVGVNWDLVAGGRITREVRGLPDDYWGSADTEDARRGWLVNYAQQINDHVFAGDNNLTVCSDELTDWTFINDLQYIRDPEPDIFSFSAPGLSGQFVFGPDKLPKLIPYQDVKISFTPSDLSGPITAIQITKNDGTQYTFSSTESTTRKVGYYPGNPPNAPITQFTTQLEQYRKSTKFTSAWGLGSIVEPGGGTVSICYGNYCNALGEYDNFETISGSKRASVEIVSTTSNATSTPAKQYYISDLIESKKIASITALATKAEFRYVTESVISEIELTDLALGNGKLYRLHYQEVKNPSEQYGQKFLKKVTEENGSCESFPAFQFEYYDVVYGNYSATTSLLFQNPDQKVDLWGHFNNNAVSLNPSVYYYQTKTGAERYRFYPIPGLTETAKINGANRYVNSTTVAYGSLSKITYPTGGTTSFIYEPNDYHDDEANTSQYGPGIRIKQIVYEDNVAGAPATTIDYEYKEQDAKSSGKWIYRSVFGYHDVDHFYAIREDQSPEAFIMYDRVTVKQAGKGKTIYQYILPGTYPLTNFSDWNASQTRIARSAAGCTSVGQLKLDYFSSPFAPNTNYDFERGVLSKIEDYNQAGNKIHEKEYEYQRLGTPTTVVKGLKYERLKNTSNLSSGTNSNANIFIFSQYSLLTNIGKVVLEETERTMDLTDIGKIIETASTYTYSSVHNMLSDVQQLNSDGATYKTRFKYAKDFSNLTQPNSTDINSVMLKKLNDEFQHGTPVETISSVTKGGTETVTGASLTIFGSFPDSLGATSRALPKESKVFNGTSGFSEATVSPASGSNQILDFNTSVYRASGFIDAYDYSGNPVSMRDAKMNSTSIHVGYKKSMPVAQVMNAGFSEAIFADFETYTGAGFNIIPGGSTYTTGRSGRKALQMQAGNILERTTLAKGKGKYYRFSCYVLASASVQLTFKILNGSTTITSTTVNYGSPDLNNWKYLDGVIEVSGAPSTFKVKVETNAAVKIDDIAFYPEAATIHTSTYEPLKGKTSETDSRGVSTFYEYDGLGRLKYVKDQDKTLRQTHDYYYTAQPAPTVSSAFTSSLLPHQVVMGSSVTYNALTYQNCGINPLTYDWYVDELKVGDNVTSFNYTYTQARVYTIKLVVSHPTYGQSSTMLNYDVKQIGTGPIGVTVTDLSGTNSYAFCDADHNKSFKATLSGCYVLQDVSIQWYYNTGSGWTSFNGNASGESISLNGLEITFNPIAAFNGISNLAPYSIKCEVSVVCPVTAASSTDSYTRSISYNGNQQCQ